jgi:hypothetical protein
MRIAIASTGKTLESEVDWRFGRAAYFIIVDTETMDFSAFRNDRIAAEEEAGIDVAKVLAGAGVQHVDCDVEEPSGHIFLKPKVSEKLVVAIDMPEVDAERCDGYGKCSQFCQYTGAGLQFYLNDSK